MRLDGYFPHDTCKKGKVTSEDEEQLGYYRPQSSDQVFMAALTKRLLDNTNL